MMVTLVKRECQERWKPAMNSVIKGAGYVLVHTPEMVVYNGTTLSVVCVVPLYKTISGVCTNT